jgi:hypothetical protein
MTRSQVSLNFSGFARYWASVRGADCFAFARELVVDRVALDGDSRFGVFGETPVFFDVLVVLVMHVVDFD